MDPAPPCSASRDGLQSGTDCKVTMMNFVAEANVGPQGGLCEGALLRWLDLSTCAAAEREAECTPPPHLASPGHLPMHTHTSRRKPPAAARRPSPLFCVSFSYSPSFSQSPSDSLSASLSVCLSVCLSASVPVCLSACLALARPFRHCVRRCGVCPGVCCLPPEARKSMCAWNSTCVCNGAARTITCAVPPHAPHPATQGILECRA